jgi:hypothetical protein
MSTLVSERDRVQAVDVQCSDTHIIVTLADGQKAIAPLWYYPRLLGGTPAQRAHYEIMRFGIHWPELDEDLSIRGILEGRKAPGATPPAS